MSCPYLMNLWRDSCGMTELPLDPSVDLLKFIEGADKPDLESLQRTEWSERFVTHMKNRLIMGGIRYGLLHGCKKKQFDRIASIKERLEAYTLDGNMEHLVDAANLCLLEFEEGNQPNRHFTPLDDIKHVKRVQVKGK